MNLFSYSNNPLFPDRYTRDKNWVRVLPIHGRPLQTAELIEMQSILHDNLKQGMNTLFVSGSILQGLRCNLANGNSQSNLTISISSGKMYVEGIILEIPEQSILVPVDGEHNIGILIRERTITEEEDPDLRDPIKGGAVYGLEGAARLIWEASPALNNPNAYTIARVIDGNIIQRQNNPFEKVERILAEYTYDRNGNFCVRGLEPSVLPSGERAVADRAKYQQLEAALNQSQTRAQEALADATDALSNLEILKGQLNEAVAAYQTNPTSGNRLTQADLEQRVSQAEEYYNRLSRLVVASQRTFQSNKADLDAAKLLLVDKALFSINPGIAYVEGYRVCLDKPFTLSVPKDLSTTRVTSANFNYSGSSATAERTLSLLQPNGIQPSLQDLKNDSTLIELSFDRIPYQGQYIEFKLRVLIDSVFNRTGTGIRPILDFIVEELNKTSTQLPDPKISFVSSLSASAIQLRSILKTNVLVTIVSGSTDTLQFESTSITEEANQIKIQGKVYRNNNPQLSSISQLLAFEDDGSNATYNLSGASRSSSYQLGFRPVAEVLSLTAEMEENLRPVVRGNNPSLRGDFLGDDSIIKITRVIQGNTVYREAINRRGGDYQLRNQSEIEWVGANQPDPGTTYYVSFIYTQPLAQGSDYILNPQTDSIEFIGNRPARNRRFSVDYSYYLAKAGVITLNRKGEFNYLLSEDSSNPLPPTVPDHLLPVATFKLFANREEVQATNCKVINFSEVRELTERVKRNSSNLEVLKLDTLAYQQANSRGLNLVGLWTNTLQDLSRIKLDQTTAAVSPGIQAFTGGYEHKDVPLNYTSGGSIAQNRFGDRSFVLPTQASRTVFSQNRLTRSRAVKDLSSFPQRGKLYVSQPLLFFNQPTSLLTACDAISQKTSLLSRISPVKPAVLQQISDTVKALFKGAGASITQSFSTGNALAGLGPRGDQSFLDIASNTKLQRVTLEVKAEGLSPNSEGYKLYFSGIEIINPTRLSSTPLGVIYPGSLKAKADGVIHVRFQIPDNLSCGIHSIEIKGPQGYSRTQVSCYNNLLNQSVLTALANWEAISPGTQADSMLPIEISDLSDEVLLVAGNSLTAPGVIPEVVPLNISEGSLYPLLHSSISQTFELPDYTYLSQVKIKLKSIPTQGQLKIHLRDAGNQGPLKNSYGIAKSTTYSPSSTGTLWSTFTFERPLLLQPNRKYSITLEADNEGFEVFTAIAGEADLITGNLIGDQLYFKGDFYTSKDGTALTFHSEEDLCFELVASIFPTEAETLVLLGSYGIPNRVNQISHFCLNTRDIVVPGASILYEYRVNNEIWNEFQPNLITCLSTRTGNLQIRAKLKSLRPNVAPLISFEGSSVSLYSNNSVSTLVSQQVEYASSYTQATVSLQYILPSGVQNIRNSIKVEISSTSEEWIELNVEETSLKVIDAGLDIYEVQFRRNLPEPTLGLTRKKFSYKITLTANSAGEQPVIRNIISYVS